MKINDPLVADELKPALSALLETTRDNPPLSGKTLGFYRKRNKFNGAKPLTDVPYESVYVDAGKNYRGFRLWLINAHSAAESMPAVIHFHGGGFVMGNCENSLPRMQKLAKALNCVVVSVEYGLAPEVKVIEAQAQHYAALEWVFKHYHQWGINHAKIALLGISAGGGHAAALAQQCANKGNYTLAGQALLYPMLDDCTGSTAVAPEHRGKYLWTAEQNAYGWQALLGKQPGSDKIPSEWIPARAEKIENLPPTYIGVGELDLFLEENALYAKRLQESGIKAELNIVPGAFHAFESIAPDTELAREFNERLINALKGFFECG